jgi:hypothetical protein
MIHKATQLAQAAADNMSRRRFVNHLMRGAIAATGILGSLLAFPAIAGAAGKGKCCCCAIPGYDVACYCWDGRCSDLGDCPTGWQKGRCDFCS